MTKNKIEKIRRIKFRAWHEQHAKYYEVISIDFDMHEIRGICDGNISRIPMSHIILEQFSGLYDKNGKEIYEGDIVRYKYCAGACNYDQLSIIEFPPDSTGFIMQPIGGGLWSQLCNIPGGHMKGFKDNKNHLFEVIGTVHENPELPVIE